MVRALGLAGLSCTLVADPDVAARWSRFVTDVIDERDPDVLERLRPPLLIKPAVRDGSWGPRVGWAKALAVSDQAAWDRMRPKLGGLGARLLVQEEVPGAEDRIESYHAYVRADGEILGEFTG